MSSQEPEDDIVRRKDLFPPSNIQCMERKTMGLKGLVSFLDSTVSVCMCMCVRGYLCVCVYMCVHTCVYVHACVRWVCPVLTVCREF